MPALLTREQRLWRYRIFALTWLAYAGFYLCRKNFSVAMPLLADELGYSKMQLAGVIFGYSLLYATAQFCFGLLADRLGPRLVVGFGLFVSMVSNVFMGMAGSLALLAVLSCINGAGQGTGWPGLTKNMSYWFRHEERGVVMAWWTTNYVLGGFLATLFAAFVAVHPTLLTNWAWRRTFWLPAALLLVVAVAFVSLVRNKPRDVGLPEISASRVPDTRSAAVLLGILRDPGIWIVATGCFFSKVTRYAFLFWLPLYMTEHLNYTADRAGYTSSLFEFVGLAGALLAGYVSDKLMHSRRLPVAALMLAGLGVACSIHPKLAAMGFSGIVLSISVIGVMNYGPDTILQGATSQDIGSKWAVGTAAGFISGFGSLGQLLSPFLVAYIAQRYGWNAVFQFFVFISFVGAALLATKWNYGARGDGQQQMSAADVLPDAGSHSLTRMEDR